MKQTDYNSLNIKQKVIENTYTFIPKEKLTNFAAGYGHKFCPSNCPDPTQNCGINFVCYAISTEQINHLTKTEIVYQPDGSNPLTTITTNFYENPIYTLPTKTEVVNNKGHLMKTETKYPYNYPGVLIYDSMVNRNMIGNPIESIYTNVTLTKEMSRSKTNYQFWFNNSLILPSTYQKSMAGNNLQIEASINSYDVNGNLLQLTGKDGIANSFIWGYNKQYPVAKIINKQYSDVISQSGINTILLNNATTTDAAMRLELNKLRTLFNCFITTYTYKPLIGITSETDPNGKTLYYEYDSFNRLKTIKDQDGKIIKTMDYKYQATLPY